MIKMVALSVYDDDDFTWDCKTYPREPDSKYAVAYLKNPSKEDVSNVVSTMIDEFEESFDDFDGNLLGIRDGIVEELRTRGFYSGGNYEAYIRVLDFEDKIIKFANTGEEVILPIIEVLDIW